QGEDIEAFVAAGTVSRALNGESAPGNIVEEAEDIALEIASEAVSVPTGSAGRDDALIIAQAAMDQARVIAKAVQVGDTDRATELFTDLRDYSFTEPLLTVTGDDTYNQPPLPGSLASNQSDSPTESSEDSFFSSIIANIANFFSFQWLFG
ncbi:MAG: hypothetical protein AAFO91_12280, partial [Bacteroidota bacterium]